MNLGDIQKLFRRVADVEHWCRTLRINGDGVYFHNTPRGATATVRQKAPPRQAIPRQIKRFKVTTAEASTDVCLAKLCDDDGVSGGDEAIRHHTAPVVDEEILATMPAGGVTGGPYTYNGEPVLWEEIGGGDVGAGQYQFMVYSTVAQNVAGWENVRANPEF